MDTAGNNLYEMTKIIILINLGKRRAWQAAGTPVSWETPRPYSAVQYRMARRRRLPVISISITKLQIRNLTKSRQKTFIFVLKTVAVIREGWSDGRGKNSVVAAGILHRHPPISVQGR